MIPFRSAPIAMATYRKSFDSNWDFKVPIANHLTLDRVRESFDLDQNFGAGLWIIWFWLELRVHELSTLRSLTLHSIQKGSSLCPNPFEALTPEGKPFEGIRAEGWALPNGTQSVMSNNFPLQRIMVAWSVHQKEPFEILHSKGLFEVSSFEHAAMIVFTLKCPSDGDISHLKRTANLKWWFTNQNF